MDDQPTVILQRPAAAGVADTVAWPHGPDPASPGNVPPPEVHGKPAGGRGRRNILVLVGAVIVAALIGRVAFAASHGHDNQAGGTSTARVPAPSTANTTPASDTSSSSVNPTTTHKPTSKPSKAPNPQTAALNKLRAVHDQDRTSVEFTGQWVAQLASKVPGITDPLQKTASGSHTFAATDILAEYERAKHNPDFGSYVLLLKSTDYGKRQLYHNQPLWITVAQLPNFTSAHDVTDWCALTFPDLSPRLLLDSCTARQLNPPA